MLRRLLNRNSLFNLHSVFVTTAQSINLRHQTINTISKRALLFSCMGVGLIITSHFLPSAAFAYTADGSYIHEDIVSTAQLSKVPVEKATVGVIPYYVKDNQVYLLLGRERVDGLKKERAGKFSDFGGSVELDGTTLLHNAVRELKEESMRRIEISEKDLLEKGKTVYKKSSKNRDIFYIFYPMTQQEYNNTKSLSALWPVLCANKIEASDCEKDQFLWLSAKDLLHKEKVARDIDGKSLEIKLREFFMQDCIENPAFARLLEQLIQPKNKAFASNKL